MKDRKLIINDLAGLQSLINSETPESSSLEYKAAAGISNAKEITKDVSSMANGPGGIIIYGLMEKDNKPDQLDPVKEKKFSREYLDQVIALGIQPPIKFKTEPIPYDGGYIYAVHIDKGETAHMSLDQHRYYRRYNFIAVPMEDYQIRDIMNRSKNPQVELTFTIKDKALYLVLRNNGPVLAKYVRCKLDVPAHYIKDKESWHNISSKIKGYRYKEFNNDNVLHPTSETFIESIPLNPDVAHSLYNKLFDPRNGSLLIFWKIWADNATAVEGSADIINMVILDINSY